ETGERKVIFPTRMNLQLLAESRSATEAMERAAARTLVTVEPKIMERPGGRVLVIPPNAGYGAVEEPVATLGV
ncbi:MAG TPA: NUDIX hydrolase, partial [Caulobacteraceae bacterium]